MDEREGKPMGNVIHIDEARIRDHLGEMVRGTVEEALNAMLDAGLPLSSGPPDLLARRFQGSSVHAATSP